MRTLVLVAATTCVLAVSAWAETITVEGHDLDAIQAAIDAAAPGDTVHLPAGVYEIGGAIRAATGVSLTGAGQDQTVVRFTGDEFGVMLGLSKCEDVTVSDLTFDGAENPRCTSGIVGGDSRRLLIERVTVRDLVPTGKFGPHGIHFNGNNPTRERGVTDSIIRECTVQNIGVGASFGSGIRMSWGSSRNQVLGCVVRTTGRGGIFADNGSDDLVISGNTVEGSGGTRLGIEIWGGCERCVIEDNVIDHWLSVGGCDWFSVRRNTVSRKDGDFAGYGLEIIGSYGIVTDNLVDDGQCIGISVSGPHPKEYVFYGYNTIRRCSQWGAQFQGEAGGISRAYLYRCDFLSTTAGRERMLYPNDCGHGFRTNGNTNHLVMEECRVADNAGIGLQLGGPNVDFLRFIDCTIAGNGGPVSRGPGEYSALELADCTVEGNANETLPQEKPFPTAAPAADFTVPEQVASGEELTLQAVTDAEVEMALWDLGDGPPVVGEAIAHTWKTPGDCRITLIVWDTAGRAVRVEKTLRVVE